MRPRDKMNHDEKTAFTVHTDDGAVEVRGYRNDVWACHPSVHYGRDRVHVEEHKNTVTHVPSGAFVLYNDLPYNKACVVVDALAIAYPDWGMDLINNLGNVRNHSSASRQRMQEYVSAIRRIMSTKDAVPATGLDLHRIILETFEKNAK